MSTEDIMKQIQAKIQAHKNNILESDKNQVIEFPRKMYITEDPNKSLEGQLSGTIGQIEDIFDSFPNMRQIGICYLIENIIRISEQTKRPLYDLCYFESDHKIEILLFKNSDKSVENPTTNYIFGDKLESPSEALYMWYRLEQNLEYIEHNSAK